MTLNWDRLAGGLLLVALVGLIGCSRAELRPSPPSEVQRDSFSILFEQHLDSEARDTCFGPHRLLVACRLQYRGCPLGVFSARVSAGDG